MSKSIMQDRKECYLCRKEMEKKELYYELPSTGLHRHHCIFGAGKNRKFSEHYGLWVYVCAQRHHVYGRESPHENNKVREELAEDAQREFEKTHTRKEFTDIFGRNYIRGESFEGGD